ncbi:hypothetical protein [Roseateles sp.]|uniref:hypothetical protein n=1 Tax=Roseateles sp. TaxID=1971397 RepID=UPI0039EC6753
MRHAFIAALLCASALGASAQTEKVILSKAQRLECLVKPSSAPRYPRRDELDLGQGAMRVLLKFSRPDGAPEVQVLFNSAREAMQDQVHDYVGAYRLPCLGPDDGTVTAVQDFLFDGSDRDPVTVPEPTRADASAHCMVLPRFDMQYGGGHSKYRVEHVRIEATFAGVGDQPPEVQVVFARASNRFEQAVRERVAQYRMPCRTAKDKPFTMMQQFTYSGSGQRFGLTRDRFPLMEFLGQTREPGKLKARFDLRTMGCPFSVDFMLGGGAVAHEASVNGPIDPNKVAFLRWLEGLQISFASREVADDLFGTQLQIDVPCGLLDLRGEAS